MLKPLGHRILVKPDAPPEETASGLILPQDHDHVATSGVVVATGPGGSLVRYKARQRAIKDCLEIANSAVQRYGLLMKATEVRDEIAGMLNTPDPEHDVKVGDRVAFAAEVGLIFHEDGEEYITLNEDDVVVLVSDEVAA